MAIKRFIIRGGFKMFPELLCFLTNRKQYNRLCYTASKIVPLCNYTLLAATVKVLETFLEATLWKPFQLFRRILNYVSSITKAPSLQCWFQSREQLNISCSRVRRVQRDAPVLSHCFWLRNPWPKPTGVLEHCREGKRTIGSPFFGAFVSDCIAKATKNVSVHFFIHSFTFRDEPVMDKVLAIKRSCKLYQRVPWTFWSYYI